MNTKRKFFTETARRQRACGPEELAKNSIVLMDHPFRLADGAEPRSIAERVRDVGSEIALLFVWAARRAALPARGARCCSLKVIPMISNKKPGPQYDAQSAEIGNVTTTLEGVTYTGFYRVRAQGKGIHRYHVTADKRVTVDYKGQTKHTSVGMRGLQWTAETLLSELVAAAGANRIADGTTSVRS